MAKKGEWVKIHLIVLEPSQRASNLPEETKKVPLEAWINGFLEENGEIGEKVRIRTLSDRTVEGTLVEINPRYTHDFGDPVPELLKIGPLLKKELSKRDEL
jgi:hypothetical protein|uniref:2-amino-4-ketopentanoate thiolase n=1 Tax=Mesoaciditoga lauensis TaxID=1495039 RepID=A0A7V3RDK5_9BACT